MLSIDFSLSSKADGDKLNCWVGNSDSVASESPTISDCQTLKCQKHFFSNRASTFWPRSFGGWKGGSCCLISAKPERFFVKFSLSLSLSLSLSQRLHIVIQTVRRPWPLTVLLQQCWSTLVHRKGSRESAVFTGTLSGFLKELAVLNFRQETLIKPWVYTESFRKVETLNFRLWIVHGKQTRNPWNAKWDLQILYVTVLVSHLGIESRFKLPGTQPMKLVCYGVPGIFRSFTIIGLHC